MDNNTDKQKKVRKPLLKRWWIWAIAAVVLFFVVFVEFEDEEADKIKEATAEETDKQEEKDAWEETGKILDEEDGEESHKLEGKELEKNQKEKLQKALDKLIEDGDGDIIDARFSDNHKESGEFMTVVISDAWYNTPEHEKERYAESAINAVKSAVYNSGLQEHGSTIIVSLQDDFGKEIAKQGLTGKIKIKG